MESLVYLVIHAVLMYEAGNAQQPSLFPFLNTTSITMVTGNNTIVNAFFTSPQQPRSGVEMAKKFKSSNYVLYTRKKPTGVTIKSPKELMATTFDSKKPVKFITHGWLSSGSSDTCERIKKGYIENFDVNVLVFDWRELANDIFYLHPMLSVPDLARHHASFITYVIEKLKVDPGNIHLIGHSLGAQISGLVWKHMNGTKLGRVTGLDPAFPGFDHIISFNDRISNESAQFVDVIHSCGGSLGILKEVGHVDFYPNGGISAQPGCTMFQIYQFCSHGRSWQYFANSLLYPKRKFIAIECDSWINFLSKKCSKNKQIIMGEETPHTARGIYYLKTNAVEPYAMDETK